MTLEQKIFNNIGKINGDQERGQPFHIAFGVNSKYLPPMAVTIASIAENNLSINIIFHVFIPSIAEEDVNHLEMIQSKYNKRIIVHVIGEDFYNKFSSLTFKGHFDPSMYLRLFIPHSLAGFTDRVLYLDADIICINNFSEINALDISEYVAAVIGDLDDAQKKQAEKFKMKYNKYFNSGVMFINIPEWINKMVTERALEFVFSYDGILDFHDQDALNVVLEGEVLYIESKWNVLYNIAKLRKNGFLNLPFPVDGIFMHFIGGLKPWHKIASDIAKRHYIKYHSRSPWAKNKLLMPSSRDARLYSKLLFNKGKLLKSFLWFKMYLWIKFKNNF